MSYLALLVFLVAGYAVGKLIRLPDGTLRTVSIGLSICLFLLVFTLGVKLGANPDVVAQIEAIGVRAMVLAAVTTAGSILFVMLFRFIRQRWGSKGD